MTRFKYILRSFLHYLQANLLVAFGVSIITCVLTGSLIIGDSVRYSLEQTTLYRLGGTTHLVAGTDRYFRQEMAAEIETSNPDLKAVPILLLEGVAVSGGGQNRVNKVQVVGVDNHFKKIAITESYSGLQGNEIIISENLAARLEVGEGDNILVRIKKASLIPMNAPFVSAEGASVSLRARIRKIVGKEDMGRFSLKTSQTAPYNIFISLERLNSLMEFEGKANNLLISTELSTNEVKSLVINCLTPADAGLYSRHIEATGEVEIYTKRVFMESKIAETLEELTGAAPLITYFVNVIGLTGQGNQGDYPAEGSSGSDTDLCSNGEVQGEEIPYSFVSSLGKSRLDSNEIILTQWAADDLDAEPGDIIKLKFLEIGPLRQLNEKESEFVLKEIVPMDKEWADSTRMPWIPGLSDAGHCREWDAGVPIDMNAIRDKDEEYWERWKGTPKAYISLNKARELWKNRFGVYTAVRYPTEDFDNEKYHEAFASNILPGDLGILVEPVREKGLTAAQNGTDFSGLFLGLSFFILAASIILTALLFRLNLETRSAEVGILSALGFKEKQVRILFLMEGSIISLFGGITGLFFSILYTSGIFRILNTLWYDVVRTNILLIRIYPETLLLGLIISVAVSLGAIYISVYRFQSRKTAELQKRSEVKLKKSWSLTLDGLMWIFLSIPLFLLFFQLLNPEELNTSLFFLSGAMLMIGSLLLYRKFLFVTERQKHGNIRLEKLSSLNLARNKGRSLSIVILFAIGTFLVVSTGSNKLDLFADSTDRSSGTGGFLFFAETTMPVLFNLNDQEKRVEEGIYEDFTAVQLRRVEGDDASCLNLNRVDQPAILGVDPDALKGRFSFVTRTGGTDVEDPWEALKKNFEDGTVPAIADQTVIKWGLGKNVGDELIYQNELGDTLRLKLVAGTKPSVFQGYVMISNRHFLKHYPSSSGSNVFLIDGDPEKEEVIRKELSSVFRDFGWEMETTAKRLVEFYSVTNTYLSIFLALGALGMILGTIGLAVILARTILERRREIALMQAIGFNTRLLFHLLFKEYFLLLAAGVITGFISAVLATLPAFLSDNSDASPVTVILVTGLIILNGIIWIAGLCWLSLKKKNLISSLRVE